MVVSARRGHCLLEGVPGLAKTLAVETLADGDRRIVRPPPVHARPAAGRHRRHPDLPGQHRDASTSSSDRSWSTSCSPTRSTGPRPRCSRRCSRSWPSTRSRIGGADVPGPRSVPRAGHPEPDRVRGRVPPARGPARPLPDEGRRRLPEPGRGGRDRPADGGRRRRSRARCSTSAGVRDLQQQARDVYVDRGVVDYAVSLTLATREPAAYGLPDLVELIAYGASPRASLGLVAGGRALALLRGRTYALPQDVFDVAPEILRHRLVLSYEALAREITADQIVNRILGDGAGAADRAVARIWARSRSPSSW